MRKKNSGFPGLAASPCRRKNPPDSDDAHCRYGSEFSHGLGGKRNGGFRMKLTESSHVAVRAIAVAEANTTTAHQDAADYVLLGMRAITLISKSKPASQLTPIAVQFG